MEYINFFQKAMKIKEVSRTGWQYKKVPNPESVADHSFGVTLLALTVPLPDNINRNELVQMAIIHDVGEYKLGDLVWENGKISNEKIRGNKHKEELKAFTNLFNTPNHKFLLDSSIHFLNQSSDTAKFLKELDKLEMIFQALRYENYVEPNSLNEFWENAESYIKTKEVKKIFDQLKTLRNN